MFKRLLCLVLIVMLASSTVYASSDVIVRFDEGFGLMSSDIHAKSLRLVERYPDLLEYELLGYSYDKRPIYVLRMALGVNELDEQSYVTHKHIFIQAGLHARETYNPFVVLRIIEDYARDIANDNHIKDINIKAELDGVVLHFIPLSNPDGHDIVKGGPNVLRDQYLRSFYKNNVKGDYKRLKGNARGVDLNRNFVNYTLVNGRLVSDVGEKGAGATVRSGPALDFYAGKTPGSEVETQILQDYMLRYDFRSYLSYHSMGRVMYGASTRYGTEYSKLARDYTELASRATKYPIPGPSNQWAWGYEGRFVGYNTNKPLITVETIPVRDFPTPARFYQTEYYNHALYKLPVLFARKSKEVGYFKYKLYKDNVYVRDMVELEYAKVIAEQMGAELVIYDGPPRYFNEEPVVEEIVPEPNPVILRGNIYTRSESEVFRLEDILKLLDKHIP